MESQSEWRRRQILSTTFEQLSREGYRGTSAKKLAAAAGISDTLIFKYFGTLDQLFAEIIETRLRPMFNFAVPAGAVSLNDFIIAYLEMFESEVLDKRSSDVRLWVATHIERPDLAEKLPKPEHSGVWLELSFRLKEKRISKAEFKLHFFRSYLDGRMFQTAGHLGDGKAPSREELLLLLDFFAL